MVVIHISEAEAARDFPNLMTKVRAGAEVLIEDRDKTVAILRAPVEESQHRTISEALRLAQARGSTITLDDEFGRDLEEIIRSHEHEILRDPSE